MSQPSEILDLLQVPISSFGTKGVNETIHTI